MKNSALNCNAYYSKNIKYILIIITVIKKLLYDEKFNNIQHVLVTRFGKNHDFT